MVREDSLYDGVFGEAGTAALVSALRELTALQTLRCVCACEAGNGGVVARAGRRVVR